MAVTSKQKAVYNANRRAKCRKAKEKKRDLESITMEHTANADDFEREWERRSKNRKKSAESRARNELRKKLAQVF